MFFTLCTNVTLAVGEVDMDASWESDEICGPTIRELKGQNGKLEADLTEMTARCSELSTNSEIFAARP